MSSILRFAGGPHILIVEVTKWIQNIVYGNALSLNWLQRLLRLFANYFLPLVFTLGMVVWTSLVRYAFHYNAEIMDHGFCTKFGSVRTTITISAVFGEKEGNPINMGDTK